MGKFLHSTIFYLIFIFFCSYKLLLAESFELLYNTSNSAFLLKNWNIAAEIYEKLLNTFPTHKKIQEVAVKLIYSKYKLIPQSAVNFKSQLIQKLKEDLKNFENLSDRTLSKYVNEMKLFIKFIENPTYVYEKISEITVDIMSSILSDEGLTKLLISNNPILFYDWIEKWLNRQKEYIPINLLSKLRFLQAKSLFRVIISPILLINYQDKVNSSKIGDFEQKIYDLLMTSFKYADLVSKEKIALFGANYELLRKSFGKFIPKSNDKKANSNNITKNNFFIEYLESKKGITSISWDDLW